MFGIRSPEQATRRRSGSLERSAQGTGAPPNQATEGAAQFLTEAILISALGGTSGVVIGAARLAPTEALRST